MKISLTKTVEFDVSYLLISAEVRYWEDASVNGIEDTDGSLIPKRNGALWEPVIDLHAGVILGWPSGTVADIHYKVCDAGEYWFLNSAAERIAKYKNYYVPDFLPGDHYGDYIIMKVDGEGKIQNWDTNQIDDTEWEAV